MGLRWSPANMSKKNLVLLTVISLLAYLLVEKTKVARKEAFFDEKIAAAEKMKSALDVIKDYYTIHEDPESDIENYSTTELLGKFSSDITTDFGKLSAKAISLNPNFAAVIVDMLKKANLKSGDIVAIGCTGSFPGVNIATYSAVEILGMKPVTISSVGSSMWGANDPQMTWVDMEKLLIEKKIFSFRSVAASLGGIDDQAKGIGYNGRKLIRTAIQRNNLTLIEEKTLDASIKRRMAIYNEASNGAPIKLYINIGGGIASLGSRINGQLIKPGLRKRLKLKNFQQEGVITIMASQGIPVINLINISEIAKRYNLPQDPTIIPAVGNGSIFSSQIYRLELILTTLVTLTVLLFALSKSNIYLWTAHKISRFINRFLFKQSALGGQKQNS
ncbi:MAG TPA: poly-gamma-glutamate system protein [Candidatus Brocadiia bacterium]|nr:poly-gamma-glutamate system protein [Candidatus Brocadiales bacterium]